MKKMIAVCFMLMFLLAVVTGCPSKPVETKSGGGNSPAMEFIENDNDNISTVSSDEYSAG